MASEFHERPRPADQAEVLVDAAARLESPTADEDPLDAFSFVMVTNSEKELLAGLDDRIRSRLHAAETVHFDRYGVTELTDILAERTEYWLASNAITRDRLLRIADAAAGDARVGLSILRSAARRADRESAGRVTDDHVRAAIPEARREVRSKNLETLRREQRTLFDILGTAPRTELAPGDLYERYTEQVDNPRTKRTVRSWLRNLEHYNLVEASGSGPNRTYRVRDAVGEE